jgi:succinate dehydrogenase / fumarate reductase cytochrome b subunit
VTPVANTNLVERARTTRSTIALKLLMAVSGLVFIGYLLLHMYGNLMIFGGHDTFNEYAHHLRTFGEPMLPYGGLLWVIRVLLIVSLVAHVGAFVALTSRASKARTQKYEVKKNLASSLSSRTMRWGGVALLIFVVWHLIHFTIPKVNPDGGPTNDPYNLVVDSFSLWWMTLIYLLALVALALHLHHGTWSAMQTLGLTGNARARARAKTLGWVIAMVIAGGFALGPLSIALGLVD